MAVLTLTIDDTKADLLKAVFGHPEWTNQELSRHIKTYFMESLKLRVKAYQEQQATDTARGSLAEIQVIS